MVLVWLPLKICPPVLTVNLSQVPALTASAGLVAATVKTPAANASMHAATTIQGRWARRFLEKPDLATLLQGSPRRAFLARQANPVATLRGYVKHKDEALRRGIENSLMKS